jgi:hypothetical protein
MNFKNILPILLIAAGGGAIYLYIKKMQENKDNNLQSNEDNQTASQSTQSTQTIPSTPKTQTISLNKVLKNGSKGLEVKLLQIYLNQYLKPLKRNQLIVDGGFGKDTLIALNWLFKRQQTSLQEIKDYSIARGLDWALMKKIAKQILAQKQININTETF